MTNRTWNLRSKAVSTQAKPVARMAFDRQRMNSDHNGPVRPRVGRSRRSGGSSSGRRGEFVTEPCELAVDSPVSPIGVLVGEADGQTPEFRVDRWASRVGCGRLGPVPCNDSAVPSQHRFRSDNQERRRPPRAIGGAAQECKDRAVGFVELRPVDLASQHEDLVTERKDLSVSGITGREDPADSGENEVCMQGKQVHETSPLLVSA